MKTDGAVNRLEDQGLGVTSGNHWKCGGAQRGTFARMSITQCRGLRGPLEARGSHSTHKHTPFCPGRPSARDVLGIISAAVMSHEAFASGRAFAIYLPRFPSGSVCVWGEGRGLQRLLDFQSRDHFLQMEKVRGREGELTDPRPPTARTRTRACSSQARW